jgi:hypothetical protein
MVLMQGSLPCSRSNGDTATCCNGCLRCCYAQPADAILNSPLDGMHVFRRLMMEFGKDSGMCHQILSLRPARAAHARALAWPTPRTKFAYLLSAFHVLRVGRLLAWLTRDQVMLVVSPVSPGYLRSGPSIVKLSEADPCSQG